MEGDRDGAMPRKDREAELNEQAQIQQPHGQYAGALMDLRGQRRRCPYALVSRGFARSLLWHPFRIGRAAGDPITVAITGFFEPSRNRGMIVRRLSAGTRGGR